MIGDANNKIIPADVEEEIVWSPLQEIYMSLTKQLPYDGFVPVIIIRVNVM